MKLRADWRLIIKKAWSFRLMVVAALLSAVEIGLPLYQEDMPRGLFAALSGLAMVAAMVSRVIAQREFERES